MPFWCWTHNCTFTLLIINMLPRSEWQIDQVNSRSVKGPGWLCMSERNIPVNLSHFCQPLCQWPEHSLSWRHINYLQLWRTLHVCLVVLLSTNEKLVWLVEQYWHWTQAKRLRYKLPTSSTHPPLGCRWWAQRPVLWMRGEENPRGSYATGMCMLKNPDSSSSQCPGKCV